MTGSVLPDGQAVISVRVRGPNGQIAKVDAVIDTGFNDFLTLPPWVIQRLELVPGEDIRYVLADGAEAGTRQYKGEIEWLGTWRRIFVAEVEANALIGTGMMRGELLTIEMIDGGRVEIRPMG
jgi:clan AA aspartic protease